MEIRDQRKWKSEKSGKSEKENFIKFSGKLN